jgi:sulfatase maturation enzyme AslB (radical SAM superfamily)/collagenase-like PrtC family protease
MAKSRVAPELTVMTNLAITSKCNRNCDYCFSLKSFERFSKKSPIMSVDTFRYALDFLRDSKIAQVRLLGGEPTQHPEFETFVSLALAEGFSLLVFTNGLISARAKRVLDAIEPERITILLNTAAYGSKQALYRLDDVYQTFGQKIELGYNIHTPNPKLEILLDLIAQYGLRKRVRLGIAQPTVTGYNNYLRHTHYKKAGVEIADFSLKAQAKGVEIDFDCGFVPCMFSARALDLFGDSAEHIGRQCNPILDVLPNGAVISCFALAELGSRSLKDFKDAKLLRKAFERKLKPYRNVGMYRECTSCIAWQSGRCTGGCLSSAIRRLRFADQFTSKSTIHCLQKPPISSMRDSPKETAPPRDRCDETLCSVKWTIPYIDQPMSFWRKLDDQYAQAIEEVYFPIQEISPSGRPPQPDRYLKKFLQTASFSRAVLINPIVLSKPVEQCAPAIIKALSRLSDDFGITRVTVSSFALAHKIRKALPEFTITASVLMDVAHPRQASLLNGICDCLVPASRILRDLASLRKLRSAFSGKIRLLVNEGCLPDCLFRVQHFYEMATHRHNPCSLCEELLQTKPWLRLTGAWVLPQHLHLFRDIADDMKIAGRVTLKNPDEYLRVLYAYIHGVEMGPDAIGGGPASMTERVTISEVFYAQTLECSRRCDVCTLCKDYFEQYCCTANE